MADLDPLNISKILSEQFAANSSVIILSLFLGYSLLFTYFIKNKKYSWGKFFGEVDKILLSSIVGVMLFLVLYFYTAPLLTYYKVIFNLSDSIATSLNNIIGMVLFYALVLIWGKYFHSRIKISINFSYILRKLIFLLILISMALFLNAFVSKLSLYRLISTILIQQSTRLVVFSLLIFYVYTKIYTDYRFQVKSFKKKEIVVGISGVILALSLVSYLFFPYISKISDVTNLYYLDANGYPSENFQKYSSVDLFRYQTKQFEIEREGIYNWVPLEIENLVVNRSEESRGYYGFSLVFLTNETYNSLVKLTQKYDEFRKFGVEDVIYYNNSNSVVLQGHGYAFNKINMSGLSLANDEFDKISVERTDINKVDNGSYVQFKLMNNLTKLLYVKNLHLVVFHDVGKSCSMINATGLLENLNNSEQINSISCVNSTSCNIATQNLDFNSILVRTENSFSFFWIEIPRKSTISMNLSFDC